MDVRGPLPCGIAGKATRDANVTECLRHAVTGWCLRRDRSHASAHGRWSWWASRHKRQLSGSRHCKGRAQAASPTQTPRQRLQSHDRRPSLRGARPIHSCVTREAAVAGVCMPPVMAGGSGGAGLTSSILSGRSCLNSCWPVDCKGTWPEAKCGQRGEAHSMDEHMSAQFPCNVAPVAGGAMD